MNFSHYALFDQLETICKEKMLTTALIHLIITSTTGNDKKACLQILNNVFNRFKQAKKCKTLDEVKEILWKDEESKFSIEASYEYIGIKLMYIIKLFVRGDKFPAGKLNKNQRPCFLGQSVEFLMRETEAVELMKLNARTFFSVVSELFLNNFVAESLVELNQNVNDRGEPFIEYTHTKIIETLHDRILLMQKEEYIKFEYSYFIVQIAASDFCKTHAAELSHRVYFSIKNTLEEFINLKDAKDPSPLGLKKKYYYVGPEGMDPKKVENEILLILPTYTQKMDDGELEDLIFCANELKFDMIKIHLYEQKQEFDRCIDIYLNSPRVKKQEVFKWLFRLNQKKDKQKEKKVEDLRNKISSVIEELVVINSEETGYIIDMWLPDKQKDVIDKLSRKPALQLQYLESYLKEREEEIKEVFESSGRSQTSSPEAQNYKTYLLKHVQLLANNNEPKLIDVVKKDYYPIECLKGIQAGSSLLLKEAQAYLKKRAGMYKEAITIFLDLLKQIDKDMISTEILAQGQNLNQGKHVLSFKNIYYEVLDILQRQSKENPNDDSVWFDALRSMFKIRDKLTNNSGKLDMINDFIFRKIAELMQLMSEHVDFEKVIEVLLEIDPNVKYHHSKQWFKGLYVSKNDQELLYTSAKRLLSNENSALIDAIIERNNIGFIGDREKQVCALCKLKLGGFVNDGAFILTQCEHQFHSKCFFEEIKNRQILEGKKESDIKPECPVCKKHHIEFDSKKSKPVVGGRRRRGRKKKDATGQDDEINESEDEMSSHPLMEKKAPIRTMEQYEKEYKNMDGEVYKQKLSAFDEDYAASQLNFMID